MFHTCVHMCPYTNVHVITSAKRSLGEVMFSSGFVTLQNQILQSIVDGPVCLFVCLFFVCFFCGQTEVPQGSMSWLSANLKHCSGPESLRIFLIVTRYICMVHSCHTQLPARQTAHQLRIGHKVNHLKSLRMLHEK